MQLPWSQLVLLLLLLLQLVDVSLSVSLSRRWSGFNNHYSNFKPFKPKRARFAAPIHGFSNIFQNNGIDRWRNGAFPTMQRTAWSNYPPAPQRLQPIPLARNQYYQSFPIPQPNPVTVPPRRHQFVPASNIQHGKVPTHFMTDAELHGLVCVPASSLASALAGHQDQVTQHQDGTITTHRTVLAGTDGSTSHSTRITSGGESTVVETRANSSSGVQQHRQSVQDTGSGVVRTSTGSAFSGGRPGLPTHADVITTSSSEGSNSRSRASASGYDITGKPLPARSVSQSVSRGLVGLDTLSALPPQTLLSRSYLPAPAIAQPDLQTPLTDPRVSLGGAFPEGGGEDESEEEAFSSEESSEEEEDEEEVSESEDEESPEVEEDASIKLEDQSAASKTDTARLLTDSASVSTKSNTGSSPQDKKISSQNDDGGYGDSDAEEEGDESASSDDDAPKQGRIPANSETKEGEERDAVEEESDEEN